MSSLPVDAHASLDRAGGAASGVQTLIGSIEKRIMAQHRVERGEPAAREHPRHWRYWGHRDRRDRHRSEGFPIGT